MCTYILFTMHPRHGFAERWSAGMSEAGWGQGRSKQHRCIAFEPGGVRPYQIIQ